MGNNDVNNINNNIELEGDVLETKTITMNLESLQQQYNVLLIQYQAAVAEYLNYLNQPNVNLDNEPLVYMQGYAYNGTGPAGPSQATTLTTCVASCSRTKNCNGATFVSNQCLLKTGSSPIVPSSQNSYAIVPKSVQLLFVMENINEQLISINKEITELINDAQPLYETQTGERFQQQQVLVKNYEELQEERAKILNLLNEYDDLNNTYSADNIMTNQNYYTNTLLIILAILFIILLYYISGPSSNTSTTMAQPTMAEPGVQYGGDFGSVGYFIIFLIIIFVFVFNYLYMNYYY